MVFIPRIGNNTIGTRPVAGRGIASVNHQQAINNATPKVCHAYIFKFSGFGIIYVAINKIKPNIYVTKTYLANRLLKFIFNNLQNFFTIIILNPGYNFNIIKIPINRWMIYPIFRHRPTK